MVQWCQNLVFHVTWDSVLLVEYVLKGNSATLHNPKSESVTVLQNTRNCTSVDTVLHPRRLESSVSLLCESHTSHCCNVNKCDAWSRHIAALIQNLVARWMQVADIMP